MTTEKYTFDDLTVEKSLRNNFYIVPDYQREYVWEADKEVAQLLTDVYEAYAAAKNKEYFIGTTVVYYDKGSNVSELIDGQQRTTTLFLMLCAFRNIYKERGLRTNVMEPLIYESTLNDNGDEVNKYHLELQYEESSRILETVALNLERPAEMSASGKRLEEAYQGIYRYINDNTLDDNDELKGMFLYFYNMLKFIQITTPDINDALKIFETINERGVGLNPMDLLKNLIFRQVDRSQFDKLKERWKQLVSLLETNNEKPLRFLRYFIMANYPSINNGQRGDENTIREDEIYKWMASHADVCGYNKEPFKFVELLLENARCYVYFAHGKDKNGNRTPYLDNIIRLGGGAFRQHLIVLLAARNMPSDMFDYLSRNIENYLFYALFTKVQAKIFEKLFGKWDIALKDVRTQEELTAFVADNIKAETDKLAAEYKTRFLMFKQSDLQLYRVRYILAKLTQYVDMAHSGAKYLSLLDTYFKRGTEIEHILPQSPSEELRAQYENYDELLYMLGNLTLLEQPINGAIKNNPYEDKVPTYAASIFYLTSSLHHLDEIGVNTAITRINKYLKPFDHWDAETIAQRQELLYNLSLEIWKVE